MTKTKICSSFLYFRVRDNGVKLWQNVHGRGTDLIRVNRVFETSRVRDIHNKITGYTKANAWGVDSKEHYHGFSMILGGSKTYLDPTLIVLFWKRSLDK